MIAYQGARNKKCSNHRIQGIQRCGRKKFRILSFFPIVLPYVPRIVFMHTQENIIGDLGSWEL